MMTILPVCFGSLAVLLLHWLKCPSFDYTGGKPITSFFNDVGNMLTYLPQNMSVGGGGGILDLVMLVILVFFAVWFLINFFKACLGILWMLLQWCDSVLGSFGQWILL